MRVTAYVLAGDPTWAEASVAAYYRLVERIVVSYDVNHRGWTGHPIPTDECLERLKAIDVDRKMEFSGGDYFRPTHSPIDNDTHQRQVAMDQAAVGADWVLALDNDEIMPRPERFLERLERDVPASYRVVEWPLRVFFQVAVSGELLEVCDRWGRRALESVPIAFRPGVELKQCRRTAAPRWWYVVPRDWRKRVRREAQAIVGVGEAVLHLSWIRTEAGIRTKLASWGHAPDFEPQRFLRDSWNRAPRDWRRMRDLHPIWPRLWPRLKPASIPIDLLSPSAMDAGKLGIASTGRR